MDQVEGYVERITFRSEETGYSVLTITGSEDEWVLVGNFPTISEGEYIQAEGEIVFHPSYGEQMKVSTYRFLPPSDSIAIERYLGSGSIKGIGPALAKKIVKKFGKDTFRIVEEEPERLSEIKGISERMAMEISGQIIEKREIRDAMLFLQQYGISLNLSAKIYKRYGMELYRVIRENPYRLADDIQGVGFKSADEIAVQMGIARDSDYRVRSAVLYVLSLATGQGHTFLPEEELFQNTEDLLGIHIADFRHLLDDLQVEHKIIVRVQGNDRNIYLRRFFLMERETANRLQEMNILDKDLTEAEIQKKLSGLEKESEIKLDDNQRRAVIEAVRNGVTVITGGPGTGKTTTINIIIRYLVREGLDILLAAPTGRAAKRMTETTGYEATTIHRMLELNGDPSSGDNLARFQKNEDSPLEADAVIIDEMSMVDITLMHALLKAMVPGMRLILVGDVDQLPSVGPGEVLKDLIASEAFPVVRLQKIFRQAEESDIIMNAHMINRGERVEVKPSKDFLFILRDHPGNVTGATITLLKDKLPNYVKADKKELQVLTPMRKGPLGSIQLNKILQEAINPKDPQKVEKEFSFGLFREGDKVMQIRNDYQITWEVQGSFPKETGTGVFNGDTGIIQRISMFEETITVLYDENKIVTYPFTSADEIELAYAVTIHKSQGSEYPAVILPLFSGPKMLMTRNLLYTGITRAKKCVCIVGSYNMFEKMIENDQEQMRYSGLLEMIRSVHEWL